MGAARANAKKKDKRRRHAGTRKAHREAIAATAESRAQQPRRAAPDKSGR